VKLRNQPATPGISQPQGHPYPHHLLVVALGHERTIAAAHYPRDPVIANNVQIRKFKEDRCCLDQVAFYQRCILLPVPEMLIRPGTVPADIRGE
jgi:hypothetical protein